MKEIPTAEAFFKIKKCRVFSNGEVKDIAISDILEFTKLHVEATLKAASEKATWKHESFDTYFGDSRDFDFIDTDGAGDPSTGHNVFVDKDSILNSYPLDKIK